MPGTDSGEFRAVVSAQVQENCDRLERLEAENRQLRKLVGAVTGVMGRLVGCPPQGEPDPGDELAARRRLRQRHAG